MHDGLPSMKEIKSSNVKAIGHDAVKNELHVQFRGGGHYVYEGVPNDKMAKLLAADSVGKFIGEHIKGVHNFRKL